jgi:hypothetical protein
MKKLFLAAITIAFLAACNPPNATENKTIEENKTTGAVKKINLKASNGKFVCADMKNGNKLVGDRNEAKEWETFTLIDLGNKKVNLKASYNKFVSADKPSGDVLIANRDNAKEWETFEMIDMGNNKVSFKAYNGKFVSCDQANKNNLFANRDNPKEWETFEIIYK